jgi:hypothetical protein
VGAGPDAAIADINATKGGRGWLAVFMLVAVLWMLFVLSAYAI